MAGITKRTTAFDDENLSGRSQKLYFEVTEEENYTYYGNASYISYSTMDFCVSYNFNKGSITIKI